MRNFVWILPALGLVAGCTGGDGGKPGCGEPGSCGAGSYCAHTPDGNVCWPDDVAPVVTDVHATCSDTPCLRTSTLHVTATVTDDAAVGGARVRLDFDPDHPRDMQPGAGDVFEVDVPLEALAFPFFEHTVTASVIGWDEARNEVGPVPAAEQVNVTRLKWTRQLKGTTAVALSSPAVLADGRAVLSGSDGKLYVVAVNGQSSVSVTVSSNPLAGPPSVGSDGIWVAGFEAAGRLFKVGLDLQLKSLTDCTTTATLLGPPAILVDRVVAASTGVEVVIAKPSGACTPSNLAGTISTPVAVGTTGNVLLATGSILRSYTVAANSVLGPDWTGVAGSPAPPAVGDVSQPLAVDAQNGVWTTAADGTVFRTTSDASTQSVDVEPPVSASSSGSIVLANGDAVLGDYFAMRLRVLSLGGDPRWASSEFSGRPRIPLALGSGVLLVTTSDGWVYALLESSGATAWSHKLSGQSLEPPNIWTAPGATTSTAYLAGADGNLYAVIVDGALDTAAPWPKAYHDPQNTSNAGYAP